MIIQPIFIVVGFIVVWLIVMLFALTYLFLEKTWRIEQIVIDNGVAKFRRAYVKDTEQPLNDKNLKVADFYRDSRQFWKLPYYVVRGCRASLVTVYIGDSKEPVKFAASAYRGDLLKINKESTAINQAMSSTFQSKTNSKLIIILLLLFIALMLGLSFYKSGGF